MKMYPVSSENISFESNFEYIVDLSVLIIFLKMLSASFPLCGMMSFIFGHFTTTMNVLPKGTCGWCCQITEESDIKYHLYTRLNPSISQLLRRDDARSVAGSTFDTTQPTVIYLHGFFDNSQGPSGTAIRTAYLARGDYNIILVDWSPLIVMPWYISAVQNSRYMGESLAVFIVFLLSQGAPLSSLHLIGFSLGAEAAGFAGKALRRVGVEMPRITGLDPAYPGYTWTDRTGHLAQGDAAFVDVIHTNSGVLGFPGALGDVDFYPNGPSPFQPGCDPVTSVAQRMLPGLVGCSHERAWRYYAESVRTPRGFPASRCVRWDGPLPPCRFAAHGFMGFAANNTLRGKMYLLTNPGAPYARSGP